MKQIMFYFFNESLPYVYLYEAVLRSWPCLLVGHQGSVVVRNFSSTYSSVDKVW